MGIIEGGILALLSAIGGWFGGFFGAYFKRKGENLATKEDFADLKEQTRQLVQATKEIESRIDDQVWNRQRQWELKRDILFDATKRMADVGNKLLSLSTFWEHKFNGQLGSEASQVNLENKYLTEWQDSMRSFEEMEALTQIICSIETMRAFTQLGNYLRRIADKIVNDDQIAYKVSATERNKLFGLAKLAVRKELGIETSVMPLSS
ncbi:MAG: hypothetical protein ABI380_07160 [Edaphobacter sp.]